MLTWPTLFATESLRWALGPVQAASHDTPGIRAGPSRAEQHPVFRVLSCVVRRRRTVCGVCERVGWVFSCRLASILLIAVTK